MFANSCSYKQMILRVLNTVSTAEFCFIQQEEDSFYQQIGLEFEEENSKIVHLEHGFVWC
jgi:hypothetical protein